MSGIHPPDEGLVLLDGTDIRSLRRRCSARRVTMVHQHADTELDVTSEQVVRLGRITHRGCVNGDNNADLAAVARALVATGMTTKANRSRHALPGGERQRTHIASALDQEPDLLLDEPTNHLDIAHQLDVLALVAELPITSYIALHDLNHAAMFRVHVLVLDHGRTITYGTPTAVITSDLVRLVYGVDSDVGVDSNALRTTITCRRPSSGGELSAHPPSERYEEVQV
ncbi:ABC transporter ATP-binding protein [Rhodococcus qingshengii]|uniref:ABC transporter ATP-binding protein n=1 Tax=Rhodococcus qingshengii TaxID=334542 RepID=UPI0027DFCFDC|nr:ATP-binding cassette domain-containing protein [Rhodococcus qingshengii]